MSDVKLVQDYKAAKTAFAKIEDQLNTELYRVFLAYAKEKDKVSTRTFKPKWITYYIDSFKIKSDSVHFNLAANGRYGYTFESTLALPQSWLELNDDQLNAAVLERLEQERIKFLEFEAKREQQKAEAAAKKLKDEYEQYLKLDAKFNSEDPRVEVK